MAGINRGAVEVVGADTGMSKSQIFTTVTGQVTDLIGSIFKKPAPAPAQPSTPPWLMPVIIGGIGVMAVGVFATTRKRRR